MHWKSQKTRLTQTFNLCSKQLAQCVQQYSVVLWVTGTRYDLASPLKSDSWPECKTRESLAPDGVSTALVHEGVSTAPAPKGVSTALAPKGVSAAQVHEGVSISLAPKGVSTALAPEGVSIALVPEGFFTAVVHEGVSTAQVYEGVYTDLADRGSLHCPGTLHQLADASCTPHIYIFGGCLGDGHLVWLSC